MKIWVCYSFLYSFRQARKILHTLIASNSCYLLVLHATNYLLVIHVIPCLIC